MILMLKDKNKLLAIHKYHLKNYLSLIMKCMTTIMYRSLILILVRGIIIIEQLEGLMKLIR